jgi:hypothetical protein
LAPYYLEVRSEEDARKATDVLIRSQQKQVLDIRGPIYSSPSGKCPDCSFGRDAQHAQWGHDHRGIPWFSNLLACLHGYFLTGAFLTVFIDILDGVNGKLARTKLQYSWFGKHEDIIDYFYENSWYITFRRGFSSLIGGNLPLPPGSRVGSRRYGE